MSVPPPEKPKSTLELARREFLRRGAVLPLALTGLATNARSGWARPRAQSQESVSPSSTSTIKPIAPPTRIGLAPTVALGFWPRGAVSVPGTVPSRLLQGDLRFEEYGANLMIYGNAAALAGRSGRSQTLLLNSFPQALEGAQVSIVAWSLNESQIASLPANVNPDGGCLMFVPVKDTQGILSLTADFSGTTSTILLTTGEQNGMVKLQVGTYVIAAPSPATGKLPDLAGWQWIPTDRPTGLGRLAPLGFRFSGTRTQNSLRKIAPMDFPYLVVEVTYGALDGSGI